MIGKALLACKEILTSREEGDRMIILVSDGESFDLSGGNDETVAQTLKREQHRGLCDPHLGPESARRRSSTSRAMTGGEVFPGRRSRCAQGGFQRIDAMRETKLEKTASELLDDFVPVCIAGLSLSACRAVPSSA